MQGSGQFYLGTAAAVGVATLVTPFYARAQGASADAIDSNDTDIAPREASGRTHPHPSWSRP
jgi:hypothetical protein